MPEKECCRQKHGHGQGQCDGHEGHHTEEGCHGERLHKHGDCLRNMDADAGTKEEKLAALEEKAGKLEYLLAGVRKRIDELKA